MPWLIRCSSPACGKMVTVDEMYAGGRAPCPECGSMIKVSLDNLRKSNEAASTRVTPPRRGSTRLLPFDREKEEGRSRKRRRTEIARREMESIMPPEKEEADGDP